MSTLGQPIGRAPAAGKLEGKLDGELDSELDGPDERFIADMLPRVSRTFALSISMLPPRLRDPIGLGYLLCRIVDCIEDEADLDQSARERLFDLFDAAMGAQNGQDGDYGALEERSADVGLGANAAEETLMTGAGAVFRAFRALPRAQREAIRPHVLEMSRGMREYTERADARGTFSIDDIEDLERYCYFVAGTVGELLTDLFLLEVPSLGEAERRIVHDNAVSFGLGLQLVNIVKDVAEDADRGICFLPTDRAAALGVDLSRLTAEDVRPAGLALVMEICDVAEAHLTSAQAYTLAWPGAEGEAVRLFCAVPLSLALATLDEVQNGGDALRRGLTPKITRKLVGSITKDAIAGAKSDDALRALFDRLGSTPGVTDANTNITAETTRRETGAVAIDRATGWLREAQDEAGFWKGELETNVTMDAEDLFLRQFLGIRTDEETQLAANWIRSQQRDDGTWANARGGPADLSTTVEAYVALKLAGDDPEAPHMARASAWIVARGGLAETRVFTRIWLALFGLWPWDELPEMPPELMLMPSWMPLNVYDFACWARQTVVALTIVMTYRPVRSLGIAIDEIDPKPRPTRKPSASLKGRMFEGLDRALSVYAKKPIAALRERGLREGERWIVQRQEADGSWGGIQPPWVYSMMALTLRGYPLDHPIIKVGLEGLDRFTIRENGARRLEACQSPVWDTAYAVQALADAGVPGNDEAMLRGADWLLGEEVRQPGDWTIRRPNLEPGGWAFEFANVNYPDVDDTTEVIIALRRAVHPDPKRVESAIARGVRWTIGMQSKGGGWGAFDADNTQALCRDIPFCDFGEVIDEPTADVTAHAVELLCREGLVAHPATKAGVRWLLDNQEDDGSWFGRWGVNYVYGTGGVLMALAETDLEPTEPAIRRAVRWLHDKQNADGGWGEDIRSYDDRSWAGRGTSTPSQTAWALLGLLAVGDDSENLRRGIDFLISTQNTDGSWDEDEFTGTGFPGDFYINYHLYRQVFPTMALGRWARSIGIIQDAPKRGSKADPALVQLRT
ncbi:MAG: squalene--hopene cyclase [Deltaproteobacteria bacterium]|nr:MAG: squalene--hopene cyclase [Deltaproteobacteria bacterium]